MAAVLRQNGLDAFGTRLAARRSSWLVSREEAIELGILNGNGFMILRYDFMISLVSISEIFRSICVNVASIGSLKCTDLISLRVLPYNNINVKLRVRRWLECRALF